MVDTAQVAEHCIKLVALEPRTFAFATALNLMFVCDVTDERSIHLLKKNMHKNGFVLCSHQQCNIQ